MPSNKGFLITRPRHEILLNLLFHWSKPVIAEAVVKGCRAFIGYKRKFAIAHSTVDISHPFKDTLAQLFIEPSNLVPVSLLKGNSAGEAYKKSQKAMRRNFSFMQSSSATGEQQSMASYLWGNIRAQVVLGDQGATV